jgi:hypothetical protein
MCGSEVEKGGIEIPAATGALGHLVEQTDPALGIARIELFQRGPIVLERLRKVVRSLAEVAEFLLARARGGNCP